MKVQIHFFLIVLISILLIFCCIASENVMGFIKCIVARFRSFHKLHTISHAGQVGRIGFCVFTNPPRNLLTPKYAEYINRYMGGSVKSTTPMWFTFCPSDVIYDKGVTIIF